MTGDEALVMISLVSILAVFLQREGVLFSAGIRLMFRCL